MTCTVSGIAKRPDGSVYANATFKVMPSPATPVGQDGAVWFPRETTIATDGTGAMLVDLVTGNYAGWDTANGFKFEFAVPDAPTASWADCFNAAAVIVSTIVSNAQLADMQTGRLKGRTSAGTGDPEDLTAAQVKSLLAIGTADVAGLGSLAAASSVNLSTQATGILQAAQEPAHTGDVTNPAGSLALTIAANAVSNDKLAQVATARIKGRKTAGTGAVEDLTGAEATALLDTFTSGAKGLAPASGGGTTNFLRADGTWAAPAGGGSSWKMPQIKAASGTVTKFSNEPGGPGINAASANQIRMYPYVPPFTDSFSAFGVSCTTAVAASNAKVVIYASDPVTGWPTTLLGETGDISCATIGARTAALPLTLTGGVLYWLGVRTSSNQTLATAPSPVAIAGRASFADSPDPCVTRTLTYATAAQSSWTFLGSEIAQYTAPFMVYGVTT